MRMASIAGAGVSDMVSLAAAGFMLHHGWAKGPAGVRAIRHFLRMRVSQGRQHPRGRRIRGARASIAAAPEAGARHPAAAMVERRKSWVRRQMVMMTCIAHIHRQPAEPPVEPDVPAPPPEPADTPPHAG